MLGSDTMCPGEERGELPTTQSQLTDQENGRNVPNRACFSPKFFGFDITREERKDFILSQWSDKPVVYAVYSSLVSLYTLGALVYTLIRNQYGVKIFIWLTYWSYFDLVGSFVLRTISVWFYIYRHDEKGTSRLPLGLLKLQWILSTLSCSSALLVSILYWAIVFNGSTDYTGVNSHAVNLVLVVSDLVISRYPIRIQHFYLPSCFCAIYALFSAIYWALGGTNHLQMPYIYKALDYSNNLRFALLMALCVPLLVAPVLHCVVYGCYRTRRALWQKLCDKNKYQFSEPDEVTEKLAVISRF